MSYYNMVASNNECMEIITTIINIDIPNILSTFEVSTVNTH